MFDAASRHHYRSMSADDRSARGADEGFVGVLYALGAFGIWGLTPVYFKAVAHVPAIEVVAHRIVWALPLLWAALLWRRRLHLLLQELCNPRHLMFYGATALLVSTNWLIFIWAIHNDRLLEASLGYYINPLVNVLLGVLFLRERLNARQLLAVALAGIGVLNLIAGYGSFPWIALALALTFGLYGLLRKKAATEAMLGLTVETLLLAPLASLFLADLAWRGSGAFGQQDVPTDALLVFAGVITVVPLVCFLQAANRLHLSTVGVMQYLAPTLNFLLAVAVYREPFTPTHAITFGCIWVALAIYTFDAFRVRRTAGRA